MHSPKSMAGVTDSERFAQMAIQSKGRPLLLLVFFSPQSLMRQSSSCAMGATANILRPHFSAQARPSPERTNIVSRSVRGSAQCDLIEMSVSPFGSVERAEKRKTLKTTKVVSTFMISFLT